jgi:hypothetical protein
MVPIKLELRSGFEMVIEYKEAGISRTDAQGCDEAWLAQI